MENLLLRRDDSSSDKEAKQTEESLDSSVRCKPGI
jgi:hypothetical protein